MPIIAIAGLTGSGKNYTAKHIAQKLGFTHFYPSFKDYLGDFGFNNVVEFQQAVLEAQQDNFTSSTHQKLKNFDHDFDLKLITQVQVALSQGKGVVLSTWLGPWLDEVSQQLVQLKLIDQPIKIDYKLFLESTIENRAQRIIHRDETIEMAIPQIIDYINLKEENNYLRFKYIYQLDITLHDDLIQIDADKYQDETRIKLILDKLD
jgi:cytidylate kinase